MNFEFFIAKKIISGKSNSARISSPIIKIAIAGVAFGIAVMILAIAIVTGFQKEIRDKVSGFSGHVEILPFDLNASFDKKPMNAKNPELVKLLNTTPNIKHYQIFATKPGIIKTDNDIEGIILKGVGKDYDWSFFQKHLKDGKVFISGDTSAVNEIFISSKTASKLNLKTGDDLLLYFVQQPPRIRKLRISGIYETGFEEMDKAFALCDIKHVQKLNDWNDSLAAGVEIFLHDFSKADATAKTLNAQVGFNLDTKTIKELNPQLFDWLGLQDLNAIVLISLIVMVCSINMISALLILILERTKTIGILKAVGSPNKSIRKIFLYVASFLLLSGIVVGNFIGIILCLVQQNFGLIKLDQQSYYISVVPINFSLPHILTLNILTILICVLMLIIPTAIISKISPVKAIRFS